MQKTAYELGQESVLVALGLVKVSAEGEEQPQLTPEEYAHLQEAGGRWGTPALVGGMGSILGSQIAGHAGANPKTQLLAALASGAGGAALGAGLNFLPRRKRESFDPSEVSMLREGFSEPEGKGWGGLAGSVLGGVGGSVLGSAIGRKLPGGMGAWSSKGPTGAILGSLAGVLGGGFSGRAIGGKLAPSTPYDKMEAQKEAAVMLGGPSAAEQIKKRWLDEGYTIGKDGRRSAEPVVEKTAILAAMLSPTGRQNAARGAKQIGQAAGSLGAAGGLAAGAKNMVGRAMRGTGPIAKYRMPGLQR